MIVPLAVLLLRHDQEESACVVLLWPFYPVLCRNNFYQTSNATEHTFRLISDLNQSCSLYNLLTGNSPWNNLINRVGREMDSEFLIFFKGQEGKWLASLRQKGNSRNQSHIHFLPHYYYYYWNTALVEHFTIYKALLQPFSPSIFTPAPWDRCSAGQALDRWRNSGTKKVKWLTQGCTGSWYA